VRFVTQGGFQSEYRGVTCCFEAAGGCPWEMEWTFEKEKRSVQSQTMHEFPKRNEVANTLVSCQ
jgi:hypothetical protein